jgi:hypothetical protein
VNHVARQSGVPAGPHAPKEHASKRQNLVTAKSGAPKWSNACRAALLIPLPDSSLACGSSPSSSETSREAALKAAAAAPASSAPSLGTAGSFAVLAGTAVTCTDATVTGNVGVSPGAAITQTICPVTGVLHTNDAVAAQANTDFFVAFDQFKALACDRTLTTLDGQTLPPGVYCFPPQPR